MTRPADIDLQGVIRSAASGDEAAFGHIVATYNDDMRRVCIVVTRDESLADDAVQAAWAIAWKKLGSLRQPERLKPWPVSVAPTRLATSFASAGDAPHRGRAAFTHRRSRIEGFACSRAQRGMSAAILFA